MCKTVIEGCTFKNNHGGSGCVIYAIGYDEQKEAYITVKDCTFTDNVASFSWQPKGIINAETLTLKFDGVNNFINNKVIQLNEDPESKEDDSYGGSIFISQSTTSPYKLSNLVFVDSYSGGYGGAISIFAKDFDEDSDSSQKSIFITIENCTFTNCSAGKQGGALKCGAKALHGGNSDNDINISNCVFNQCKSLEGGALYFMDGDAVGDEETVIQYCTFDGCESPIGSAIFCRSYTFTLSHSNFYNSKQNDKDSELSEVQSILYVNLDEGGVAPVVTNCTFYNNEQNIEFYSHGPDAEDGKVSSITFKQCNFSQNNIDSNGADSILDLQYITSALVTFEGCTFERNGGRCLQQESEYVSNTVIDRCIFDSNKGGFGCAIYAVSTIGKTPMTTVKDCTFSNNVVSASYGPRGVIYATTMSIKFEGVNHFIKNSVIYDNIERAVPGFNQGACGGSLFIIQESDARFELSNAIFSDSYSSHYGGAVAISCFEDEELFNKLFIDITNCTFNNCTSTLGGSFCSIMEGTISFENCNFFSGKAEKGGDIYCTDDSKDTPSTLKITNCAFTSSQASDAGGAIYCKSGSVSINQNNFTSCKANTKGASMYIVADTETSFSNIYIEMEKKPGVSGIYYSSSNQKSVLLLDGGCFSTKKSGQDLSADILIFESQGSIQFKNKPCFSGSKRESIQIIGNTAISLPDEYFNCKECDAIVVPPTPTFSIPSSNPSPPTSKPSPPSSGPTSSSSSSSSSSPGGSILPTEDASNSQSGPNSGDDSSGKDGKKSKLSVGAIVGIVIGILVLIAIIIAIVLILIRRRSETKDNRSDQISQEADQMPYTLDSHVSAENEENPLWAANSADAMNQDVNNDPFMNDFEEAMV